MGGGGLFGGGGGGTTYNVAQPPAPAPIDYDRMYAAATRSAKETMREQSAQLEQLYPKMIGMQMGTANQLSRNLDNDYLRRTREVMGQELDAAGRPSEIEAELQRQAREELALGGALSAEDQRIATQQARSAMAARGMATGSAGIGAELLNRQAMSDQRQAQRRGFASQMEQMDVARRGRRVGLASGYGDLDPYARALNPAFGLGQATMNQGTGLIGQTFGNALNQAGNVQSFNSNMQAGMYNTWMNNNAAIQAANMTGRATQQAGMMSMMGGLGGGAMSAFSDKRMKKDIKPVTKGSKADGVLGLTAYEYRYKDGDGTKHVGFMAQDVKKVLPEAVEEVDYKGKKRLAIKPQVIGAALAQELAAQQEAMFADGYTVK